MIIEGSSLLRLCGQYQYAIQNEQYILFAIRGSLPQAAIEGNFQYVTEFKNAHVIQPARVNYQTARCTIGVWDTQANKIALFPGSTLPSVTYLFSHPSSLETFNILCPGNYQLTRGIHPRNKDGFQRHEAFLMDGYALVKIPQVRKSKKKLRFNCNQVHYKVLPAGDNLHAARTDPSESDLDSGATCLASLQLPYSSSGCITIIGQPQPYIKHKPGNGVWNCWQTFMELVNKADPNKINFNFILFTFSDFLYKRPKSAGKCIRYGSQGPAVAQIQRTLQSVINLKTGLPYYTGEIDCQFSGQTAISYLKFQEDFTNGKIESEIHFQQFLSQTKHFTSYLKQLNNVIH